MVNFDILTTLSGHNLVLFLTLSQLSLKKTYLHQEILQYCLFKLSYIRRHLLLYKVWNDRNQWSTIVEVALKNTLGDMFLFYIFDGKTKSHN